MKTIDKLRIRISAKRSEARKLLELEARTAEQDAELQRLTEEIDRAEADYRTELRLGGIRMDDPEHKEDPPAEQKEDPEEKAEGDPEEKEDPEMKESAPSPTDRNEREAETRAAETRRANGFRGEGRGYRTGVSGVSGEANEYLHLCHRASAREFLSNVALGEPTQGNTPEGELLRATGTADGHIPWGAMLDMDDLREVRNEVADGFPNDFRIRADTPNTMPGDIQQMQRPIIRRVFAATVAAHLKVYIDSVGVGDALYHVLTSGEAPEFVAREAEKEAGGSTVVSHTLSPRRLTAAYNLNYEDQARVVGLEDAIRSDLRRAFVDAHDKSILIGGAAPNLPGFLSTEGGLTQSDQAAVATFTNAFAAVAEAIDGLHAKTMNDLQVVLGVETVQHFEGLFASNTAINLFEYFDRRMGSGSVVSSANVPDPVSTIQSAVVALTGGTGPNAVGPVWAGGARVIHDNITLARQGKVRLQMIALHNFKVLRTAAYRRVGFKLSA